MRLRLPAWALGAAALLMTGCASRVPHACAAARGVHAPATSVEMGRLDLLGSAHVVRQPGTPTAHFGGISGLDYSPSSGQWLLISDDRGQHAPARMYPARIELGAQGIGRIDVQPPIGLPAAGGEKPDAEALRRLPCRELWAWSSEGGPDANPPPSVRLMTLQGRHAADVPLPADWRSQAQRGPRDNLSIEGLAYTPDGGTLWMAMEAPLHEDGPLPDARHGAVVRFAKLPTSGGPAMQFAYPVDAVPQPATGGRGRSDNGVSDILAWDENKLLVVERSGRELAEAAFAFDIRLYEAEPEQTTEATEVPAPTGSPLRPLRKRLLLNLASLGLPHIDNIEAAAWGPRLADGRATLLLVSDDNFSRSQINQFLLFAVEPR